MRVWCWMYGATRLDKIKIDNIRENIKITPIVKKMLENMLSGLGIWKKDL